MGTNYYVEFDKCSECGRSEDAIHIGKSSSGWRFMFKWNPDYYMNEYELYNWLKDKKIQDEYGQEVNFLVFWDLVMKKQSDKPHYEENPSLRDFEVNGYHFCNNEFC